MLLRMFLTVCALAGLGGFLGSVIGAAFGARALFVGGFIGGVLIAPICAKVALWRGWITRNQYRPTTAGIGVGFVAAAVVAINTLSSPVGPILSTSLPGAGALIGRALTPRRPATG